MRVCVCSPCVRSLHAVYQLRCPCNTRFRYSQLFIHVFVLLCVCLCVSRCLCLCLLVQRALMGDSNKVFGLHPMHTLFADYLLDLGIPTEHVSGEHVTAFAGLSERVRSKESTHLDQYLDQCMIY
jgi:hypothetical protein